MEKFTFGCQHCGVEQTGYKASGKHHTAGKCGHCGGKIDDISKPATKRSIITQIQFEREVVDIDEDGGPHDPLHQAIVKYFSGVG